MTFPAIQLSDWPQPHSLWLLNFDKVRCSLQTAKLRKTWSCFLSAVQCGPVEWLGEMVFYSSVLWARHCRTILLRSNQVTFRCRLIIKTNPEIESLLWQPAPGHSQPRQRLSSLLRGGGGREREVPQCVAEGQLHQPRHHGPRVARPDPALGWSRPWR